MKKKKVPISIGLEEAAKELGVPNLAIPQLVMDGILSDVGSLNISVNSLNAAKKMDLSRYK